MSGLARWLPQNDTIPTPGGEGGGVGALTLTLSEPVGFVRPEGQTGPPIFVTPGTVGGIMAEPSLFTTPLGYIQSAGQRFFWAKIGLSNTVATAATSLEFVSGTSPTAFTTANFAPDGTPPEFMYVPLGYISATGSGASLTISGPFNFGSGSIVVAMHLANVVASATGAVQTFTRHLSYWRTQTDA